VAVTPDDIKKAYPLPVYNYRVEIGSETVAFSEVTGLSIAYEVATFKESPVESGVPGPRVRYMPGQAKESNVTLKKGVVRGASVKSLYGWIAGIRINQIEKKDVYIRLCDEAGVPVISWKVANAFPTKLDAPGFDAKSNDVAVETMELRAERVTIEEAG
jgi:phage tail-like protein